MQFFLISIFQAVLSAGLLVAIIYGCRFAVKWSIGEIKKAVKWFIREIKT